MLGRIFISAVTMAIFLVTAATQSFSASLPVMPESTVNSKSSEAKNLIVKVGRRHHRHYRRHYRGYRRGHHHRWRGHHRGRRHRYYRHYYVNPYAYYGYPYYYYPRRYRGNRCSYWHRKCVAKWGRRNSDYRGCMNYHRCY